MVWTLDSSDKLKVFYHTDFTLLVACSVVLEKHGVENVLVTWGWLGAGHVRQIRRDIQARPCTAMCGCHQDKITEKWPNVSYLVGFECSMLKSMTRRIFLKKQQDPTTVECHLLIIAYQKKFCSSLIQIMI